MGGKSKNAGKGWGHGYGGGSWSGGGNDGHMQPADALGGSFIPRGKAVAPPGNDYDGGFSNGAGGPDAKRPRVDYGGKSGKASWSSWKSGKGGYDDVPDWKKSNDNSGDWGSNDWNRGSQSGWGGKDSKASGKAGDNVSSVDSWGSKDEASTDTWADTSAQNSWSRNDSVDMSAPLSKAAPAHRPRPPPPPPVPGGESGTGPGAGQWSSAPAMTLPQPQTVPAVTQPPQFNAGGPGAGLPQPQMQSVPIFLAPATRHINPVSSRQDQIPTPQQPGLGAPLQRPPGPPQGAEKDQAAIDPNKQIAMQFLSADREAQTRMLRDPHVARAILQTLGESPARPDQPGVTAAAPGALAPCQAPPPAAVPPPPGVAVPPPAQVPPPPSAPKPQSWTGRMVLTRSMGKPLNVSASLAHGKVQLVELALRIAAGNGGVLNISHRVPFEDLARRTPGAVLLFMPGAPQEQLHYGEYVKYFGSKARAGVVKLDDVDALYVVPPTPEASSLLKSLEAAGAHVPPNVLLGVVAATPGPTTTQASAAASAAPKKDAGAAAGTPGAPNAAAKEPASAAAESEKTAEMPPAKEEAKVDQKPGEAKGEDKDGDSDEGPEMSKEQILDLFSNPDLIKSLQNLDGGAD